MDPSHDSPELLLRGAHSMFFCSSLSVFHERQNTYSSSLLVHFSLRLLFLTDDPSFSAFAQTQLVHLDMKINRLSKQMDEAGISDDKRGSRAKTWTPGDFTTRTKNQM